MNRGFYCTAKAPMPKKSSILARVVFNTPVHSFGSSDEICKRIGGNSSSVRTAIQMAKGRGWVETSPFKEHRRPVFYRLTEEGLKAKITLEI